MKELYMLIYKICLYDPYLLCIETYNAWVFIQISIPMHILVVGNIESGIVADCTSKELLVINLIKQEHFKHI